MRRLLLVVSVFAGLLSTRSFAADPPPPAVFSENAQVLAVEVPVTVTIDQKPVRGLRAENFEVYSGKQRQPVVGFEVVDLDAPTTGHEANASLTGTSVAARRDILLLFDLGYSTPTGLDPDVLGGWLRTRLNPSEEGVSAGTDADAAQKAQCRPSAHGIPEFEEHAR